MTKEKSFYEESVSFVGLLAPAVALGASKSQLINILTQDVDYNLDLIKYNGIYQVPGANWISETAIQFLCESVPLACSFANYLFFTDDMALDNTEAVAQFVQEFPSGTSIHLVHHLGQLVNSKRFREFDY